MQIILILCKFQNLCDEISLSPLRSKDFGQFHRQIQILSLFQELHAEATSEADVLGWAEDKTEVEIMDLLLQMKQKVGDLLQLKLFRIRNGVILQMEHLKGRKQR